MSNTKTYQIHSSEELRNGNPVRINRLKLKLTQAELAARSDLSVNTCRLYENSVTKGLCEKLVVFFQRNGIFNLSGLYRCYRMVIQSNAREGKC